MQSQRPSVSPKPSQIPMSAKARAIVAIKSEIANDLVVDYIIDHLIERNVFTEEEKTDILAKGRHIGLVDDLKVRSDVLRLQSEYFLDLLVEKMADKRFDFAYNHFFYILFKDGNYPWIGDRIVKQIAEIDKLDELMVIPRASPQQNSPPVSHNTELDAQNTNIQFLENSPLATNHQNITENVISLSDIAGYEDQIKILKNLIEIPLNKGSKLKNKISWPKSVLISGPMGTGKTSVSKALCTEFMQKMFCCYVNCGTILTKNTDQTKSNLNYIFENGIQKSPSLIILDNCEIICSKAKLDSGLIGVLGSLLNDLPKDKHVFIILVTNRLELIDDSIRISGRIDREIQFNYPNVTERFEIMKKHLKEDICDISDKELKIFAQNKDLNGFSGADLCLICKEANLKAVTDDRTKITLKDLSIGLKTVITTAKRRHSVNVADLFLDSQQSPTSKKSLTFVRSCSTGQWPRPDPLVFHRLDLASPDTDTERLSLYGPPGSFDALKDKVEASDSYYNYLSIDLSPEETKDKVLGDEMQIPFIDE